MEHVGHVLSADEHRQTSDRDAASTVPSVTFVQFRGGMYEACGVSERTGVRFEERSSRRRQWALASAAVALTALSCVIFLVRCSPPFRASVLTFNQLKAVKFFNLADDPQLTSKDVNWSYEGETGPSNWGVLSTDWGTCNTGNMQSPININRVQAKDFDMHPLRWKGFEKSTETGSQSAKEYYDGRTIALGDLDGPHIEVMGFSRYLEDLPASAVGKHQLTLKEIRIHTPSEHTIDDKRYDAEMQLLHECNAETSPACPQSKTMVVSVLMEKAREELDEKSPAFVKTLIDDIQLLGGVWSQYVSLYAFDFGGVASALKPYAASFFFFKGSLTAPPCSEDVTWFVLSDPVAIQQEHLDYITSVQGKNYRPLQKANDRVIFSI